MIPKSERDADRAICEAATDGKWHVGSPGRGRPRLVLASDRASILGSLNTQEDAAAAVNAVNRLPLYIAAASAMDARIGAIEALAKQYMDEHDKLKAAGEYAAATEKADRADALDLAVRVMRGET